MNKQVDAERATLEKANAALRAPREGPPTPNVSSSTGLQPLAIAAKRLACLSCDAYPTLSTVREG